MFDLKVFDIETYRPDWRVWKSRRDALDPARNTIITLGIFDGKNLVLSNVIEKLDSEKEVLTFFFKNCKNFVDTILVGYNILHFDIPYLVYKAEQVKTEFDSISFKPLDLFWIFPYWLHNTQEGKSFFNRFHHLGNLWKFENIVKYVLNESPNPIPNKEIMELWEKNEYEKINEHLKLDLIHTFSFLKSKIIQEAIEHIQEQKLDLDSCQKTCPFRTILSTKTLKAVYYCSLLQKPVSKKSRITVLDAVDYRLPERGISWKPPCG